MLLTLCLTELVSQIESDSEDVAYDLSFCEWHMIPNWRWGCEKESRIYISPNSGDSPRGVFYRVQPLGVVPWLDLQRE
jgi:hypothetical protein